MDSFTPVVSVVLPVYNGKAYLKEAIDSVLNQSFGNFELIIIDDGSTDDSADLIRAYDDPRIRFYRQENKGLAATLNRGIALAKGEFIARQDQDDICLPARFEKQMDWFDKHPEAGMVGTAAEIWVGRTKTDRVLQHPTEDAWIRFGLLFHNHFVHSSVMIRKTALDDVGGYSEDSRRQPPEDYELWSRMMKHYQVGNLPDILTVYREVDGSMSRTGMNPFVPNLIRISNENLAWSSGYSEDAPEVVALASLHQGAYEKISKGVKLSHVLEVLKAVAGSIQTESEDVKKVLSQAVSRERRKIIYHYFNWRSGGILDKWLKFCARTFSRVLD